MQPLGLRFFGLVLLALFVFLGVAFASYSTADGPDRLVFPQSESTLNLCGPVGAYTVSFLLNGFGFAAFFLFIPLGIETVELLRGRPLNQIFLRTLGLCLALIGISGICGLFAASLAFLPGPVIGPGGYLGTVVAMLLSQYVAVTGSCIFLASLVVAGIILIGDQTLLRILALLRSAERTEAVANTKRRPEDSVDEIVSGKIPEQEVEPESEEWRPRIFPGWFGSRPKAVRVERLLVKTEENPVDNMEQDIAPRAYELPSLDLLTEPEPVDDSEYEETIKWQSQHLERAFANYGAEIKVVDIQSGPTISQFELQLAKGLRVRKVQSLEDDLAVNLKAESVRIVPSIPGKNTMGVELPRVPRQIVRLRDVMALQPEAETQMALPVYLGKDVSGLPMVIDLAKLPHLLIAGRTGTGKSVCLNSIIVSMLMTRTPEQVRMLMIDPKMVELSPYGSIPHLMHPVVTDMRKAEAVLGWCVEKMEERYELLKAAGVRQLSEYNKLSEKELRRRMKMLDAPEEEWAAVPKTMPCVVIIVDEMADLIQTAVKEVETHIARLAGKSRAVGIHLVLATQKPTVNVVTGLIKSNLPARIAFGVASKVDSTVVLDQIGAECLLGNGDMLFRQPGETRLLRGQGTYIDSEEIEAIIKTIGTDDQDFVEELVALNPDEEDCADDDGEYADKDIEVQRDKLYNEAVEFIIQKGKGSLSLLQRRFRIGYGRAARMIDFMEEDGVVGPDNGPKAREVITTLGAWRRQRSRGTATPASRDTILPRKRIPIKSAATPTFRNDPYEPRRKPKYIEPVYEESEEELYEDGYEDEYLEGDEDAENEYEYEEEYEEIAVPPPRHRAPAGVLRFRK